jgi:hypothetical protein
MAEEEHEQDRFSRIMALTPRRFHVSRSPPFAAPYNDSLVLCGHVNDDDEAGGEIFGRQCEGIKNCKPGIWTSRKLPVSDAFKLDNFATEDGGFEALLYWVADGEIDMSQSVEAWESYEAATLKRDAAVDLETLFPKSTKWKRSGSYYDDGGTCSVISTEYLTRDAASKVMGIAVDDEELDLGYYYETLTLNGWDGSGKADFTLGGMNCMSFELVP